MKSEFVYVKPKTSEASEYFMHEMRSLHSCKVKEKIDGKSILESIKELNENVDALKEEVRILKGE